ncbi:MAG: chromosome partitioning protein ParB [Clostridiaceae bacterium]|nr:MAG: chromosome partitioning protein ParB [Clostridiaceae bacterium]
METANTNTKKPKISTLDDLFGLPPTPAEGSGEQIQEIALSQLHEFADHPFHVTDDQSLRDMAESIRTYGQLTPALARPLEDKPGEYELVSGNRRHRACAMAGLTHMKVIVKEMTRDEAIIQMVDANLQRESLFPSERAFAYKMKLEAIRRQAGRPSKDNSRQVVGNLESADIVGKNSGESGRQVQRYIRLTELIQPLLTMVDDKKIALNPAVELSYLSHDQQADLLDLMEAYDSTPSLAQAQRLKQAAKEGILDRNGIDLVMREEKPNQKEVFKLPRERLAKYFTPDTPLQKMEDTIVKALDFYYKKLERDRQAREYSR